MHMMRQNGDATAGYSYLHAAVDRHVDWVDVLYFRYAMHGWPGSPLGDGASRQHDGLLQNMLDRISDGAAWVHLDCFLCKCPVNPWAQATSVFGAMDNAQASYRDP